MDLSQTLFRCNAPRTTRQNRDFFQFSTQFSLSPVLKSLSCTEAILITVVVAYREQVKTPKDHDMTSIYQAVCSVAHCSKWDQKKNIPRYLLFRQSEDVNHHSNLSKTEPNLEPYYGSKKLTQFLKDCLSKLNLNLLKI